jgi:hypothetical protein
MKQTFEEQEQTRQELAQVDSLFKKGVQIALWLGLALMAAKEWGLID